MEIAGVDSLFAIEGVGEGVFAYTPDPLMANAPSGVPLEGVGPHGGLLALACFKAAEACLGAEAPPLRTLSIQYLSAPKFAPIVLAPKVLRAGRSITFVTVDATQDEKAVHHAALTFGANSDFIGHRPNEMPRVSPPEAIGPGPVPPFVPRHAVLVDQKQAEGGTSLASGSEAVLRFWRRPSNDAPLSIGWLMYAMDAMAPPFHAVTDRFHRCASADLRYDFITRIAPDFAPDRWVLFEWRARDWSGGWTLDECTVWNREGRVLSIARQQRKMLT